MANAPFGTYDIPTRCAEGPTSGAVALMAKLLGLFPGLENWGIFECRNTRTGTSLSEHAEGRALDLGTRNVALGNTVAGFLVRIAPQLGVQTVIWRDRIWTSTEPYWRPDTDAQGRPFADDTLAHRDHLHVGITRAAGHGLTPGLLVGLNTSARDTVAGFAGAAGSTVAGFGGDLVSSAVNPLLERLNRLLIAAVVVAGGVTLVVVGGYRSVTGRSLTRDTARTGAQLGKEAALTAATGGTGKAAKAAKAATTVRSASR